MQARDGHHNPGVPRCWMVYRNVQQPTILFGGLPLIDMVKGILQKGILKL